MDWITIVSAILMGLMVVLLFPRARHMIKHSPKGSRSDWQTAIIAFGLVILFVVLLMSIV